MQGKIFENIKKGYWHDCITSAIGCAIFTFGIIVCSIWILYALFAHPEYSAFDFLIMLFLFMRLFYI